MLNCFASLLILISAIYYPRFYFCFQWISRLSQVARNDSNVISTKRSAWRNPSDNTTLRS